MKFLTPSLVILSSLVPVHVLCYSYSRCRSVCVGPVFIHVKTVFKMRVSRSTRGSAVAKTDPLLFQEQVDYRSSKFVDSVLLIAFVFN